MDITKAQFPTLPNVAGQETFSYAQLLAQLSIDLAGGVSGTEGELISFNAGNAVENVPQGADGNVLTANAAGIPTFQAAAGGAGNVGLGALIRQNGGQNISSGSLQAVDFSVNGGPNIEFDDFGMFDAGEPDRLRIPGGENITRIIQYLRVQWNTNSTGQRGLLSDRNQGSSYPGSIFMTKNADGAQSSNMSGMGGPVLVTAGFSFLRCLVLQTSGVSLQLAICEMAVYVIRN